MARVQLKMIKAGGGGERGEGGEGKESEGDGGWRQTERDRERKGS